MNNHNIAACLTQHTRHFASKAALIWANASGSDYAQMTYAQFDAKTDEQAYLLAKEGICAGDKVVFLVKPGPDMYSLLFALYKLGAVPVLVDPGMGLKRMLHCYQSVKARAFIGIPAAALIKRLSPRFFNTIEISLTVKKDGLYRGSKKLSPSPEHAPFPLFQAQADDLLHIAFTTGSTGPAKAVECTHAMAHAMKNIIVERYFYRVDDIELITIPFIGVLTLMIGNTGVMPKMDAGKPAEINPKDIIDAVNRFQTTCVTASPALLTTLGLYAEQHPFKLESLRFVSCGGAPSSLSTMKNVTLFLNDAAHFDVSWGATEALPLAAMNARKILANPALQPSNGQGSCLGTIMPGVDVRVMQCVKGPIHSFEEAPFLDTGEIGEIVVSGPNVSTAYHMDDAANQLHKVRHEGKIWHRTGDLGYVDENNLFWFCGRKSEVVMNQHQTILHSVQCEGIINALPEVFRSALVSAKTTDASSAQPVLCVQLKARFLETASEQALEALHRRILDELQQHPQTQSITKVLFHPAFPVDIRHNAKINRQALGEFASKQLSSDDQSKGFAKPHQTLNKNAWMLVPILGWLYIFYGLLFPLDHWALQTIWAIDLFLSVVVHLAQIPLATKQASLHGFSKQATRWYTLIFGATWWKAL